MDIIGNQAILTPAEVMQSQIDTPYDIGPACIERFREAQSHYKELHDQLTGNPSNCDRAAIRSELPGAMMRMNLFKRMTIYYLESPLDQEGAGFDG